MSTSDDHHPIREYERFSAIPNHSHALMHYHKWRIMYDNIKWHTHSLNIIYSHASLVMLIHPHSLSCMPYNVCQPRLTHHLSFDVSHSHAFSVILIHSHHIHDHALWDRMVLSHTLACMSYNADQARMTPRTLKVSHSQSFSVIVMHSHAFTVLVAFL